MLGLFSNSTWRASGQSKPRLVGRSFFFLFCSLNHLPLKLLKQNEHPVQYCRHIKTQTQFGSPCDLHLGGPKVHNAASCSNQGKPTTQNGWRLNTSHFRDPLYKHSNFTETKKKNKAVFLSPFLTRQHNEIPWQHFSWTARLSLEKHKLICTCFTATIIALNKFALCSSRTSPNQNLVNINP